MLIKFTSYKIYILNKFLNYIDVICLTINC